jgi:hypothetical protein
MVKQPRAGDLVPTARQVAVNPSQIVRLMLGHRIRDKIAEKTKFLFLQPRYDQNTSRPGFLGIGATNAAHRISDPNTGRR